MRRFRKYVLIITVVLLSTSPLISQWEPVQGNLDAKVYKSIMWMWSYKTKLYASQFDFKADKFYYSTDYGNHWVMTKFDSVQTVGLADNKIIIHPYPMNFQYSTDDGETWAERDTFTKMFAGPKIRCRGRDTIWAGNGRGLGIYLSTDDGYTWNKKKEGKNPQVIFDMELQDNYIFAGGFSGLTISSDMGETWDNRDSNQNYNVRQLEIFGNRLFIATLSQGLLMSTDKGITWKETGEGLPKFKDIITKLVVHRGLIFATIGSPYLLIQDRGGIFVSADSGETFRRIVANLPSAFAMDICFQDEYIFTNIGNDVPQGSAGVYRANLDELLATLDIEESRTETSNQFYVSQPYPTPAYEFVKTKIFWNTIYDLQSADKYVCDVFGRKISNSSIMSLTQTDNFSAELSLDCSNLQNGLYFIVINYMGETKSIPILISR